MSTPVPPPELSEAALAFLTRRGLATLTTLRSDGTPHVVPVGFTYDAPTGTARVITNGASVKVANARRVPRVALCQLDGRDWITLEGAATVSEEPEDVADAVQRYAQRYRVPRESPERVALIVVVDRVMASSSLR
ncbi:MAG: PPOX class F420-dependent oxidoreductase [Kineosporiaceae bacterium]